MQKLLGTCDAYATSHQLSLMQLNHYLCVLNQIKLKLFLLVFVLGKHAIRAVDKCTYVGIIVSKTYCNNDLKRKMQNKINANCEVEL